KRDWSSDVCSSDLLLLVLSNMLLRRLSNWPPSSNFFPVFVDKYKNGYNAFSICQIFVHWLYVFITSNKANVHIRFFGQAKQNRDVQHTMTAPNFRYNNDT